MTQASWDQAQNSFGVEAAAISQAFKHIDKVAFGRAVDALSGAGRIAASGCGHSGIACQHFAHLMCCIERPARFISPAEAVHGALGFVQQGDVMLLASRGGKTSELLPLVSICRQKQATVIVVTGNINAPLAMEADIVINMYVERECDKYDSQGTASFVVLSAIFDALQVAVLEQTGFVNEQFARIHPGGAVGERLSHSSK